MTLASTLPLTPPISEKSLIGPILNSFGDLAQAQIQIPFPIDVGVVEAVVLDVFNEVGKEEALTIFPAEGVLYSQDEGVLVGVREWGFRDGRTENAAPSYSTPPGLQPVRPPARARGAEE